MIAPFLRGLERASTNILYRGANLYYIRKHALFVGGVHHRQTLHLHLNKSSYYMRLLCGHTSRAGCSRLGTKTLYTKDGIIKKHKISYTTRLNFINYFSGVLHLVRDPTHLKFAALTIHAGGYIAYLPMTSQMDLFKILFGGNIFTGLHILGVHLSSKLLFCEVLFNLPHAAVICYLAP